jgi:hypothetical protein
LRMIMGRCEHVERIEHRPFAGLFPPSGLAGYLTEF